MGIARHYVAALHSGRTNYLCGPFARANDAQAMLPAIRAAVARHGDDRLRSASLGVLRLPLGMDARPGAMPLEWIALDDML